MNLVDILQNAYRKFKSFVFYGGSLEYVKPLISSFEADESLMKSTFEKLAHAIEIGDGNYFQELIKLKINTSVFPKTISPISDNDDVVSNETDGCVIVNKINFFVRAPIEIYILDAFWACILAGSSFFNKHSLNYSFGNSLSKNLFIKRDSPDIIDIINFNTLSFYDKYFEQYKKWRRGAINHIKSLHSREKDCTMLSLDLSRFYYSANVSFDYIFRKFSNNGSNYSDYIFVHNIMKSVYMKYAQVLKRYDTSISTSNLPIPIGFLSSGLVSNILLDDFDQAIRNVDNVSYYARYVDDILIVISNRIFNSSFDAIEMFNNQIIKDENGYHLAFDNSLKIQTSKIKMFRISAAGSKNIIDSLEKESFAVSEQRLFPDVSIEIENFKSGIYKDSDSIKVRDKTGLIVDNKKLIYLLNSYLNANKFNGISQVTNKSEIETMLEKAKQLVNSLFNYHDLLSVYQKWNKIVLFAFVAGKDSLVGIIKKKINKGLDLIRLELQENTFLRKKELLSNLKNSLKTLLEVAINQKRALVGQKSGIEYRKANLMDYFCMNFPTLNYYTIPDDLNLMEVSAQELSEINNLKIDLKKVFLSPKYIHLGSYLSTANIAYIVRNNKTPDPSLLYDYYKDNIAPIFGFFEEKINISNADVDENIFTNVLFKRNEASTNKKQAFIGLANINLENHEIEKDGELVDTFYCDKGHLIDLISLLNNCNLFYWEPVVTSKKSKSKKKRKTKLAFVKTNLDFLVFPEAYLEIEYLPYLEFYARKMNTTVIVGLKYLRTKTSAMNIQAVIIPFSDSYGRKSAYTLFREKNNYSPHEKQVLAKTGLTCKDTVPSKYYCFENQDGIKFTAFICYELTDINARAAMQNKVDILFASEFNADIRYFSSVIESASREIYCYVAQANSSNYGGTRIMAPFHHDYKIVASVSGGIRNFVHIDKVDVELLRKYLNEFDLCNKKRDYSVLDNDVGFKKFKKPSANVKKR